MSKDRTEIDLIITKYDLLFEQRLTRTETICEKIENDLYNIRSDIRDIRIDFRWLVGIMLTGFAGLFGMMAHGFHWII